MWSSLLSEDVSLLPELEAAASVLPCVRADVGQMLVALGRLEDAERYLREAADDGERDVFVPLGNLYKKLGFVDKALACYRQGFELGDCFCAFNAGLLVADQGDQQESLRWIRLAANGGDARARKYLSSEYRARKNSRRKGQLTKPS
jgi:tetratricopeptide (TPR) repeat protein